MSNKWWLATGVVLLLIVGVTYLDMSFAVTNDPPGIYHRWYDGTLEKVERFDYYSHKLEERIIYGDDGETVLRREEYFRGTDQLSELDVRLPDGRMKHQAFERDGKTLTAETIRSGDLKVVLESRSYSGGKLQYEELKSEDGKYTLSLKTFYPDGTPNTQQTLEKNGDQIGLWYYETGKLKKKVVVSLTGGGRLWRYYPDGTTLKEDRTETAGSTVVKRFTSAGVLQELWEVTQNKEQIILVYTNGKLAFRQTWAYDQSRSQYYPRWSLTAVDEFDQDGKVSRHFQAESAKSAGWEVHTFEHGQLISKRYFRKATYSFELYGSLEIEETFDKDQKLTKTEDFPASKDIREKVDNDRFKMPAYESAD